MKKPSKQQVFSALIAEGRVKVRFAPAYIGVVVPARLKTHDHVIFELGFYLPVPIPDLRWDDQSITATLSFSGQPYWCQIPWGAIEVIAGIDGRGMAWEVGGLESGVGLMMRDETARRRDALHNPPTPAPEGNVVSMADFRARRAKGR